MGRPPRIDPEFGIHHVFTRGTKRWTIFHDDIDRKRFMGTLTIVCKRYEISVVAYCLMDNHFHLVLRCPGAGISAAMRDLKSIYARRFNHRHRSSGPIFEDRFGSKLVTTHRQLRQLVRYVHRNPLAINPTMDLERYPWSSHAMYLKTRGAPVWLDHNLAYRLFDDYQVDVETPLPNDKIQNQRSGLPPSEDVPGTSSQEPPSLSEILTSVAACANTTISEVHPTRRNGLIGVAVIVAIDHGGYTCHEVAEPFGYRTAKAVHTAASRARKRVADCADLHDVLVRTCQAHPH